MMRPFPAVLAIVSFFFAFAASAQSTPTATIVHNTTNATNMAPCVLSFSGTSSTLGDGTADQHTWTWWIEGPSGYELEVTDPRTDQPLLLGGDSSDTPTFHYRGFNFEFPATIDGNYTVTLRLYDADGDMSEDDITVSVSQDTRTVESVSSTSEFLTDLPDDSSDLRIEMASGTYTFTATRTFKNLSNVVIQPASGANVIIEADMDGQLWRFASSSESVTIWDGDDGSMTFRARNELPNAIRWECKYMLFAGLTFQGNATDRFNSIFIPHLSNATFTTHVSCLHRITVERTHDYSLVPASGDGSFRWLTVLGGSFGSSEIESCIRIFGPGEEISCFACDVDRGTINPAGASTIRFSQAEFSGAHWCRSDNGNFESENSSDIIFDGNILRGRIDEEAAGVQAMTIGERSNGVSVRNNVFLPYTTEPTDPEDRPAALLNVDSGADGHNGIFDVHIGANSISALKISAFFSTSNEPATPELDLKWTLAAPPSDPADLPENYAGVSIPSGQGSGTDDVFITENIWPVAPLSDPTRYGTPSGSVDLADWNVEPYVGTDYENDIELESEYYPLEIPTEVVPDLFGVVHDFYGRPRVLRVVGAVEPDRCPLDDVTVALGTHVSGGVAELNDDDGQLYIVDSQFGFSAQEPHVLEIQLGFTSATASPVNLHLLLEGKINAAGGTTTIKLKNWSSSQFVQVDSTATPQGDDVEHRTLNVTADDYVRATDDRVEVAIRQVVVAPFSAGGFRSRTDQVALFGR